MIADVSNPEDVSIRDDDNFNFFFSVSNPDDWHVERLQNGAYVFTSHVVRVAFVLRDGYHAEEESNGEDDDNNYDRGEPHSLEMSLRPAIGNGFPAQITGFTVKFPISSPAETAQFEKCKKWLRSRLVGYLQRSLKHDLDRHSAQDIPEWHDAKTSEGLSMEPEDIVLFFEDVPAGAGAAAATRQQGIVAYRVDEMGMYNSTDALERLITDGQNPFTHAAVDREKTRLVRVVSVAPVAPVNRSAADWVRHLQTKLPAAISPAEAANLPPWSGAATENGLLMPMAPGDIVLFFARPATATTPERIFEDQGIVAYRARDGTYVASDALKNTLTTRENPFTRAPLDRSLIRLRRVVAQEAEEAEEAAESAEGGHSAKRARHVERRRSVRRRGVALRRHTRHAHRRR